MEVDFKVVIFNVFVGLIIDVIYVFDLCWILMIVCEFSDKENIDVFIEYLDI